MKNQPSGIKPESWLVSAGRTSEPGAPLNVPLIPASNFIIGSGRNYSRDDGTPTWEALEEIVGGLELGKAVAFASGMAAIAAVFDQLAAGAVVVLPDDCYHGVASLAADLETICAAPRKAGAIVAVDNTFATPLNQQSLEFGATVSLQSATKFIGGHWRDTRNTRSLS